MNGASANTSHTSSSKAVDSGRKSRVRRSNAALRSRLNSCSIDERRDANANDADVTLALSLGDLHRSKLQRQAHVQSVFERSASFETLESAGNKITVQDGTTEGFRVRAVTNFFNRMKRQICKHALETSSDWPSLPLTILKESAYGANHRPSNTAASTTSNAGQNATNGARRKRSNTAPHRCSTASNGSDGSSERFSNIAERSDKASNALSATEKRRILRDRMHAQSIDSDGAPVSAVLCDTHPRKLRPLRSSNPSSCNDTEAASAPAKAVCRQRKISLHSSVTPEWDQSTSRVASVAAVCASSTDVAVDCPSSRTKKSSEPKSQQSLHPDESCVKLSPTNGNSHGAKCTAEQLKQKQLIKECEYDEHGLTWDIYGAEFDPHELGEAIEVHLQRIIQQNRDPQFSPKATCDDEQCVQARDDSLKSQSGNEKRRALGRRAVCVCS